MFFSFVKFLIVVILGLLSVAFITLLERKVLGLIGYRLGPYKVSVGGILQPIADAVKLSNKEVNVLSNFSSFYYYFSSLFMFLMSIFFILVVMTDPSVISLKFSMFFLMIVLGLNCLNSMVSGWSVFSKFSLIGSIRTVSQLISYESSLYFIFFFVFFLYNSLHLFDYTFLSLSYLSVIVPIIFYIWVPSILGELNRTPFDFSEGESELVSGFNTEFGSTCFTLIFLAEYSNIIMFCLVSSFLFFKMSMIFFFFFFFFLVIWIRGVLPRFRFDKLMMLAWKFYIPFLTSFFVFFMIFVS